MVIQLKIRFENDGIAIFQRIDSGLSTPKIKPGNSVQQGQLGSNVNEEGPITASPLPVAGGPDEPDPGDGSGPFSSGSAPITFIGPIIFTCPPKAGPTVDPGVSNGDK